MSKTTRSIALSLSVALAAVALVETAAHAKKSSGRGALFVSGKSFPTKASSENALRAAAKKTSQKNIAPTDPEATFTAGGKVPKVTGNVVFEEGEGN